MTDQAIDSAQFRTVLGNYPTGVVVVTAAPEGDPPAGLAIGSFASVSLDPPLVSFCIGHSSSSWPRIRPVGAFCVNVLADDQGEICSVFAGKSEDKFAGLSWSASRSGSPLLDGVLAWIDCDLEVEHDAGDHVIVLGRVRDLGVTRPEAGPLLFFRGGLGRYEPV